MNKKLQRSIEELTFTELPGCSTCVFAKSTLTFCPRNTELGALSVLDDALKGNGYINDEEASILVGQLPGLIVLEEECARQLELDGHPIELRAALDGVTLHILGGSEPVAQVQ